VEITEYALSRLSKVDDLILYGPPDASDRGGVVSFNYADLHPHDVGTILDRYGVAIRAGHHCTQPLMRCFGITGTARASFYVYNTLEEVDVLVEALGEARAFFKEKVFRTTIPRNVRLGEAPSHGMPVILYDVKSRGAEAYLALAREVLARSAAPAA